MIQKLNRVELQVVDKSAVKQCFDVADDTRGPHVVLQRMLRFHTAASDSTSTEPGAPREPGKEFPADCGSEAQLDLIESVRSK